MTLSKSYAQVGEAQHQQNHIEAISKKPFHFNLCICKMMRKK